MTAEQRKQLRAHTLNYKHEAEREYGAPWEWRVSSETSKSSPLCDLIPISSSLPTWVHDLVVQSGPAQWPVLGGGLDNMRNPRTG